MICPSCGGQTPGGRAFCEQCGEPLAYNREDVVGQADDQARTDACRRLEAQGRQWLLLSVFLLIGAVFFKTFNREQGLPAFRESPSLRPWVAGLVELPPPPAAPGLLPLPPLE